MKFVLFLLKTMFFLLSIAAGAIGTEVFFPNEDLMGWGALGGGIFGLRLLVIFGLWKILLGGLVLLLGGGVWYYKDDTTLLAGMIVGGVILLLLLFVLFAAYKVASVGGEEKEGRERKRK
jgi:hypothetical protein